MRGNTKKLLSNSEYIYPVTIASAVFMNKNTTVQQKIRELDNLIHNGMELNSLNNVDLEMVSTGEVLTHIKGVWKPRILGGNMTIDPEIWGIVQGVPSKPYTTENYRIAFNNIRAINKALLFAAKNGYSRATLPKSEYSVCYPESIMMQNNLTFDLGGSLLRVMFDSDKDSPYHNSSSLNSSSMAIVVNFNRVRNAHITNGEIMGDKYERIWVTGESAVENTYGVSISDGSSYCSISHCEIHGFMGDCVNFVSGGAERLGFNTGVILGNINVTSGVTEPSAVGTTVYTPLLQIPENYNVFSLGGQGYARTTDLNNKRIDVYFYKSDGTFMGVLKRRKVQAPISIPNSATQYRMKFYDETDTSKNFNIFMNFGADNHHNVVEFNELYNGHRGGITGGGSYNVIQFNTIRDNGKYNNIFLDGGDPVFPDTTRYAINQEDSFGDNTIIRHNHIYGSWHGILVGTFSVMIEGNIFNNIDASAIVVYSVDYATISGNYIQDGGVLLFGGNLPGNVQIHGNHLSSLDCGNTSYKAIITNNNITGSVSTGQALFTNNIFRLAFGISLQGQRIKNNLFIGTNPIGLVEISVLGEGIQNLEGNEFQDVTLLYNTNDDCVIRKNKFIRSKIMTTASPNGLKLLIKQCELTDTELVPRAGEVVDGLSFIVEDCDISISSGSGLDRFVYIYVGNVANVFKITLDNCRLTTDNPSLTDIIKFNYLYNNTTQVNIKSCELEYKGVNPLAVKYFVEARTASGTLSDNRFTNMTFDTLIDNKYTFFNSDFSHESKPTMSQTGGTGDYKSLITHNLQTRYPYVFTTLDNGEIVHPTIRVINENCIEVFSPTAMSINVFIKRL